MTNHILKPMVEVNGVWMIDAIIDALHKNGINEIHVVVGYFKDEFEKLSEKYSDPDFVKNPYFDGFNNISSLYVAKDYISDTFIVEGDQIISNADIFNSVFAKSGCCVDWAESTNEWLMQIENNIVTSYSRVGEIMLGNFTVFQCGPIEDRKRLRDLVVYEFERGNSSINWDDDAMFEHCDKFDLGFLK